MPNVPYPYEVNDKLVTGNGSLIPISSLSKRSLLPSLTIFTKIKIKSFECPKSIRNYGKNKAWNIRRLVDESFVPSTQRIILKIVGFLCIGKKSISEFTCNTM